MADSYCGPGPRFPQPSTYLNHNAGAASNSDMTKPLFAQGTLFNPTPQPTLLSLPIGVRMRILEHLIDDDDNDFLWITTCKLLYRNTITLLREMYEDSSDSDTDSDEDITDTESEEGQSGRARALWYISSANQLAVPSTQDEYEDDDDDVADNEEDDIDNLADDEGDDNDYNDDDDDSDVALLLSMAPPSAAYLKRAFSCW